MFYLLHLLQHGAIHECKSSASQLHQSALWDHLAFEKELLSSIRGEHVLQKSSNLNPVEDDGKYMGLTNKQPETKANFGIFPFIGKMWRLIKNMKVATLLRNHHEAENLLQQEPERMITIIKMPEQGLPCTEVSPEDDLS